MSIKNILTLFNCMASFTQHSVTETITEVTNQD